MKAFIYLLSLVFVFLVPLHAAPPESVENVYLLFAVDMGGGNYTIYSTNIHNPQIQVIINNIKYFYCSPVNKYLIFQKNNSNQLFFTTIIEAKPNTLQLSKPNTIKVDLNSKDAFFALSNSGKHLIWAKYVDNQTNLILFNIDSNQEEKLFSFKGYLHKIAWSPDNKSIAFYIKTSSLSLTADDYALAFYQLPDGKFHQFPVSSPTRPIPARPIAPCWSNDSRYILFEGSYEKPFAKKYHAILVDTEIAKWYPAVSGFWLSSNNLMTVPPSSHKGLIFHELSLKELKNQKFSTPKKLFEIQGVDGFMASYYDNIKNILYYQSPMGILSYYDCDNKINVSIIRAPYIINTRYLLPLYYGRNMTGLTKSNPMD